GRVGHRRAAVARRRLPARGGTHLRAGGGGVMRTLRHTRSFTRRRTLELLRQPWFVAITVAQPIVWLLLFGALFRRVVEIPGFHGGSYIGFLMPGVVVMTAFFSAGWTGMSLIEDMNRGILDRLLASPASRAAVSLGGVVSNAFSIVIQ